MWKVFDIWLVSSAFLWAIWSIYSNLSKKSSASCKGSPCTKKLFGQAPQALITLSKKIKNK